MNSARAGGAGTIRRFVWLGGVLCFALGAVTCVPDERVSPLEPTAASASSSSTKGWWHWRQSLWISPDSTTISEAGDTVRLTAILTPFWNRGGMPTLVEADWFLLDPEIVAIEGPMNSTSTALLRGIGPGTARIVIVYDGLAAFARVWIEEGEPTDTLPVAAVVSGPQPVVLVGDTLTLRPNLIDDDSVVIPTEPSEWSTDFDPAYLSVSEEFLVTALAPTPPGSTSVVTFTHIDTELTTEVGIVVLPEEDPGELPNNEPPGLTSIGAFDGSVKQSNGHAFGITSFGSWFSSNPENIAVVEDPSNPAGSGRSLRFTWRDSDYRGAGIATAGTFVGGPYRELYVRLRVFMESGGWDFGHKFFYVGRHTDARPDHNQPIQHFTDRPSGGDPEKIRVVGNGTVILDSGNSRYGGTGTWPAQLGQWLTLEYHFVAESSPGAANGTARLWVNDQLVALNTAVAWNSPEHPTPGFNGMQWYAAANSIPTVSHYRIGELYISGKQ